MKDISGQIFGDLTAQHPTSQRFHGNVVWQCQCSCGGVALVSVNRLLFGVTKSCGCRKARVTAERNRASARHGHIRGNRASPTYRSWLAMWTRCTDPGHRAYPVYGGRGITVDPAWADFATFLADMGERPDGTTLDRRLPHLGYSPTNCRWATALEQGGGRTTNVLLTLHGETLHLSEWARRLGCKPNALRMRLWKGWSVERALTEPFAYRTPRAPNPVPVEVRGARARFRQNYKHLYRGDGDDLTFEQWQAILAAHDHRCHYCGAACPLTMDHVTAISKGGTHTASNVVPACRSCNSRKRATHA